MDILLRTLRDGPGGIIASRDTALSTKELSIGCAPDQQIQLLGRTVAPRHAVLRGNASQASLTCLGGTRATVNGEEVRRARLTTGDYIEIGGHRLTLAEPPAGFDLAIELRPNAAIDSSDFAATFRTDLDQTWLGKRWNAWLLLGLVATFGFAIPLQVARSRAASHPAVQWAATHMRTLDLWSPGPLAPGHQRLMGDGCTSCHQGLFATVQDEHCRSCHSKVQDHIGPGLVNLTTPARSGAAPTQPCISCHREHEEPTGHLVDGSDSVCVACHSAAAAGLQPVTGFGSGRHPLFSTRTSPGKETHNPGAPAAATSGLKFSHAQHLDEQRVRRNGQAALACADCHKLSPDGERFELPTMAANCIGCHDLNFDPDAPDRRLPHGKPTEVVVILQDYFARKLMEPAHTRKPEPERRRLPGHEDEDEEPTTTADRGCGGGSIYACAMQLAAREVQVEFTQRGCVSCHRVTDSHDKNLAKRFEVEPIHIQRDYFPAARFPHGSHVIQGGRTGDAACLTCHPANTPNARSPLLPELPTCETCHTDVVVRDRTRVQCMSCHGYHPHR